MQTDEKKPCPIPFARRDWLLLLVVAICALVFAFCQPNIFDRNFRLPGIGIKTAQRLAYHIISLPDEDAAALANSIEDAHRLVHFCPICGNYTENEVCEICSDPKRSSDTLCVVKDARDVIFMERMRE